MSASFRIPTTFLSIKHNLITVPQFRIGALSVHGRQTVKSPVGLKLMKLKCVLSYEFKVVRANVS